VGSDWVGEADGKTKLEQLVSGWRFTAEDDSTEEFDDFGKLLNIKNRSGLTLTMVYSDGSAFGPNGGTYEGTSTALAAGLLLRVTNAVGRVLSFGYNTSNWIVRVTDPANQNISYSYNGTGNIATVIYPAASGAPTRTYHYEDTSFPNALTGITDENSDRFATWSYDSTGRVATSEHAGGTEKVGFTYGTGTTSITDYVGDPASPSTTVRTSSYQTVIGVVKSTTVIDPSTKALAPCAGCGSVAAYSYDANGNVSTRTDWNGNRTDFSYDTARNLETQRIEALTSGGGTTAQTRTITTQWHATFRLQAKVAEPLRMTTYVYNGDVVSGSPVVCGLKADGVTPVPGVLCSRSIQATTDTNGSQGFSATTSGSPRTWAYTYNTNGQVLTANGPRTDVSDVTTYTYYADNDADMGKRGNVATVTNALGQVTSIMAYNAHGQPLSIVDPNSVTTLFYDARQRLTSRSVSGETTLYTFDAVGQLTRVTLPDDSYLSYTYDAAHRLTQMTDNLGNKITYTLDLMGNRTLEDIRDPANTLVQTRSRVFSNLNRLYQDIWAYSQTTQYGYDDQGNLTSIDGPLSGTGDTASNQYDALNRLTQVTDPNKGVTQYAYNGVDQLTQVTDPRSLVTGYSVDGLGNLTQQTSPDTGTTANTFDNAGNLITQTDAKSQVTTYAYDALNRVTSITFNDKSQQTFAYDQGGYGTGRLTQIQELSPAPAVVNQIVYGYDQRGRVTSETRTVNGYVYITAYRYDNAGRLSRLTYPSGRMVGYSFDAVGRVSQVSTTFPVSQGSQTQVVVQSVEYQPFGGVKAYTMGNKQAVARTYDLDGRIAGYNLGGGSYTLSFDNASRITGISETGGSSNTYSYDLLDRLTQAVLPAATLGYSYDAVGNRLTKSVGANSDAYTYSGTSNRIATLTPYSGSARTFAFDANGSTTDDDIRQFTYDARGRMLQATMAKVTTTYQVNALGQRNRKTNAGDDRVFIYDVNGRLISEAAAADGRVLREYLYLGDIPIAVLQ